MTLVDSSTPTQIGQLTAQFTDLAAAMIISQSEPLHAARVVQFAAQAVPGSEHAALTLIKGNQPPVTAAGSSELPFRVDAIQYDTKQGPCLEALLEGDICRADDLATDPQWPRFAARAVRETGVRAMFSVRLFLDASQRGALNFYAMRPNAFSDLDVAIGSIFAAYASMALTSSMHQQRATHLQIAVESNRQIGIAIGILMARKLLTADQAFGELRFASQHLHRKLRDIAAEVATTGELPAVVPGPSNGRAASA
ncbi:MAG: hypothetical protein JWN95_3206 [Frankiales bacterium]|nr:hypothetical protein [Frankiales bacterium]